MDAGNSNLKALCLQPELQEQSNTYLSNVRRYGFVKAVNLKWA